LEILTNWFKQNWLWLIINIIAIVSLIGVFSVFNLEFSADGTPTISIEQPSFPDRELEGATIEQPAAPDGERGEHSALSFPIHTSGEWAIRWLVLSLTCTPLYILFGWRSFLTVKKAAGLYAFTHAGLHLLFFVADRGWLAVFDEFNFIVGLLSLLIMVPLALTSNEWSMKFMGKSWKLMHRAAYAAGVLAVLHVIFLGKGSWLLYYPPAQR
jgi:sulfoxide reductase heme-binding subunit YedZ